MFNYWRRGWHGELRFSEVMFGSGGDFMLEDGLAYIGFYLLVIVTLLNYKSLSFGYVWILALCLYSAVFYFWFLRALWGSANHCTSRTSALLIRIFTIILPIISVILFILVIIYNILSAILNPS